MYTAITPSLSLHGHGMRGCRQTSWWEQKARCLFCCVLAADRRERKTQAGVGSGAFPASFRRTFGRPADSWVPIIAVQPSTTEIGGSRGTLHLASHHPGPSDRPAREKRAMSGHERARRRGEQSTLHRLHCTRLTSEYLGATRLQHLEDGHVVCVQTLRNRRARPRPAAVQLGPRKRPCAKARHVGEVGRQRCGTIGRHEADDNAIREWAGKVRVQRCVAWRRLACWCEGCGSLAQAVLVDGEDSLCAWCSCSARAAMRQRGHV